MVYKWYILPIGGLYATYHLLGEPETTIDFFRRLTVGYLAIAGYAASLPLKHGERGRRCGFKQKAYFQGQNGYWEGNYFWLNGM